MRKSTGTIEGVYAIADSGFRSVATLPAYVLALLEGGCTLVQLRMKGADGEARRAAARAIMELKRKHAFTFIVNDDADLALEVGADGVHVGSNDEPVASIRRRAGDRLLIGYSAHAQGEATAAEAEGADYVAFGAIFPTPTKGPNHPVQGLAKLAELVRALRVPVVAIGGIGRANVREVVAAGAAGIAMISALVQAPDVAAEARWFAEAIRREGGGA